LRGSYRHSRKAPRKLHLGPDARYSFGTVVPWQPVEQHSRQPKLTVRFYTTAAGNRTVANELDGFGTDARAEVVSAIHRRSKGTQFPREDEHVKGRIRAIRTTFEGCEYRTLYALVGVHDEVLLCVHALNKKETKLPQSVIKLAERRLADWEARGDARRTSRGE